MAELTKLFILRAITSIFFVSLLITEYELWPYAKFTAGTTHYNYNGYKVKDGYVGFQVDIAEYIRENWK